MKNNNEVYSMEQAKVTNLLEILLEKNSIKGFIFDVKTQKFTRLNFAFDENIDICLNELKSKIKICEKEYAFLDFEYEIEEFKTDKVLLLKVTKNSFVCLLFKNFSFENLFGTYSEFSLKRAKDFHFEYNSTNHKIIIEHIDSSHELENCFLGAIYLDFLSSEENKKFNEQIVECYSNERSIEKEFECAGNSYMIKCMTFVNMYGDRFITGDFEDITAKKKFERKNLQAARLQSLGELAGGIAHDFNNQLMGIMGSNSILKKRIDEPDLAKYIENIEKAAANSAALIRHLLSFSKVDKNEFCTFNLGELIEDTCLMTKYKTNKDIIVTKEISKDKLMINGNYQCIQNMLINLIVNAVDAIENKKGKIILKANITYLKNLPADLVNNPEFKEGYYANLEISDNGIGINDEEIKKIFEPFFTTKDSHKGTGLGLPMVLNCIEEHQGILAVKSKIGVGTTFSIFFRVEQSELERLSEKKTNKILVVDDEEIVLMVLKDIVTEIGYEVLSFSNGFQALDYYNEYADEISLVITDMMMPEINGYELAKKLKSINKEAKVLILSGYMEDKLEKALDLEIDGFLMKPIDIKGLENKITQILEPNKEITDFIKGFNSFSTEAKSKYIKKFFLYNEPNYLYSFLLNNENQSNALSLAMELRTIFKIAKSSNFANLAEKLSEKIMLNKDITEEVSELIIIIRKICSQLEHGVKHHG